VIRISISEEGKPPRVLTFERPAVTIGRREGNDLRLQTAGISSMHCKISRVGNGYQLEDLGSTNGTYLDQQRVQGPLLVNPGQPIRIGQTAMELRT